MLAELSMLTPGCQNEFIHYQKAKVVIAVLAIMEVKTRWNSTLEMFQRVYQSQEFSREWLKNQKYSDYWPLFTTEDKLTVIKYVMEVLRQF